MKSLIIIAKVFVLAALLIISNGNLAMHDAANREVFYERYSVWFSNLMDKGTEITGYVVRTEWLPDKDIANTNVLKVKG